MALLAGAQPRVIATVVAATVAVALLGGLATEIGPWYRALKQPSWKPPDAWFGPAWTLLYALAACAVIRAWTLARSPGARRRVLWVGIVNALLNVMWSVLFFKLKRPDWAAMQVGVMWLAVLAMVVVSLSIDRLAAALLLPLLAWVGFAAALNVAVVLLNATPG